MTKLDFPDTPAVGDLYGSSGTVWRWDGARWGSTAGAAGARGRVAYAQIVANQSGFTTTATDVGGLSVTFIADPARTYRTTVYFRWSSSAVNTQIQMAVNDGAGVQKGRTQDYLPTTAMSVTGIVQTVETGASGAQTRKATLAVVLGGTVTVEATTASPAYILVEDITFEAGTSAAYPPPTVLPFATATIPSLAWYIAGGSGSSIGNPRVMPMSNFGASTDAGLTLTDSGGSITADRTGVYQASFQIQTKAHWVCWVQLRHLRSSTTINGATASDSRGTWGNPPGVTGFDVSYQKVLNASAIFQTVAGDKFQPIIWTSGGADTSALCGDNDGYSRVNILRVA